MTTEKSIGVCVCVCVCECECDLKGQLIELRPLLRSFVKACGFPLIQACLYLMFQILVKAIKLFGTFEFECFGYK
jgi:hypothetical protein